MQKTLSCLLLFLSMSAVADAQDKDVFRGKVTGPWQGHTVFLYNNVTKANDSSAIVDGTFEISVPFSHPTRHMFYSTYDTKVKCGYAPFGVLVNAPGVITIDLKTDAASVIPTTYLLDPEGKILAKNRKGKALEDFLAEVLGD